MAERTERALDGTLHVPGCWYVQCVREERAYRERWPNHCGRCSGWGGFPYYDSDTGDQGADPCHQCVERGRCPRCGGGIIAEAYWDAGHWAVCDNCGFVEGTTRGHPYPEEPCSCLEGPLRYVEQYDVWVNDIGEAL